MMITRIMESKILFTFLSILHFMLCTARDSLTIHETFKDGDLLISKGNRFAFGLFSPDSSSSWRRYLGIWYHNIPGQTVVWVANRDNPISSSSAVLSIDKQGNLVLYNHNNPVWWTNVSVKGQVCQLLDSGNLVLVQGQRILWQSFDHPTNTFLPGMKIGFNKKTGEHRFLTSWRSANDPGTGNYSHSVNPSGSPQIFLYNGTKYFWRSNPFPWKSIQDLYVPKFVENEDEVSFSISLYNTSIIARAILEHSGVIKWLAWNENYGQWKELFSFPKARCDFHGRCGANGLCDSNMVVKYECSCLPGYEPKSPRDWNLWDGRSGCVRKRKEPSSVCEHADGFVKVDSVKLPDTRAAVWVSKSMSQIDCEQECKRNCSCSAYSSMIISGNSRGCLAWYEELTDTSTVFPDIGHDLYVRVDAIELATRSSSFFKTKGMLSVVIVCVVSGWMVIVLFVYFCLKRKKKQRTIKNKQINMLLNLIKSSNNDEDGLGAAVSNKQEGRSGSHQDLELFDLNTILAATDNFSPSNKIGKGGFGTVYKGQLSNGQQIAIKRMSTTSRQGVEALRNEVALIAKLQHRNLVKLLGCCIDREEHMLIYEYLPNKSLDTFLFDEQKKELLNWERRFNIIVGIARGILYLHQDSRLMIIHRDLKSSNILLDADMNPKVSDFGMARLFKSDQVYDKTTRVVGTYGYMSPEYVVFGKFSVRSDVFSFGVVLLEIVSGRKTNGFSGMDPSLSLIGYVWEKWNENRALEVVDSSLIESCNPKEAWRCIQVGLLCVQADDMERPTMLEVVLMLKSETTLPSPKQPAFVTRAYSSNYKAPEEKQTSCSLNNVTITTLVSR